MKLYFIGEAVLEFVFEVVCYGIGKIIIPVISIDRARSHDENEIVPFPWYGIARGHDGRFVVSPGLTGFCGMVALLFLLAAVLGFWYVLYFFEP